MYHTQEKRDKVLTKPILCKRADAWLGTAYYFWHDNFDAKMWGKKSKTGTGWYEVYEGEIDFENVLDTVFDEKHYEWWLAQIKFSANEIKRLGSTGKKPTLKQLNDFFKKDPEWSKMTGILFQDVPESYDYSLIEPIKTVDGKDKIFAYKKRIQLALYKTASLKKFKLALTDKCK